MTESPIRAAAARTSARVRQIHGNDFAALHAVERGAGHRGPAGRNDDPGPGRRQAPGGLQTESGVATGHDGGRTGEVEAGRDVLGGVGGGEGGAEWLLISDGHADDATN
ncbi:hypothetical protein GCM10017687_19790 [Streptomyces echinatus]